MKTNMSYLKTVGERLEITVSGLLVVFIPGIFDPLIIVWVMDFLGGTIRCRKDCIHITHWNKGSLARTWNLTLSRIQQEAIEETFNGIIQS